MKAKALFFIAKNTLNEEAFAGESFTITQISRCEHQSLYAQVLKKKRRLQKFIHAKDIKLSITKFYKIIL